MELQMIAGQLYWYTPTNGPMIDGIAMSVVGDNVALRKDDVYYLFENLKSEFVESIDGDERFVISSFFDRYPYRIESAPSEKKVRRAA